MFSVVIPIIKINHVILNNLRILSQSDQVKQIILANHTKNEISLDVNIKNVSVSHTPRDSIYESLDYILMNTVNQPNVILLDSNIQVGKNFVKKLTTHFAKRHLYTFRVNDIYDGHSVITDIRLGNIETPDFFKISVAAFDIDSADKVDFFDGGDLVHFAQKMDANGFPLKLLNQVLCHRQTSEDINLTSKPAKTYTRRNRSLGKKTNPKPVSRTKKFSWAFDSVYTHTQGEFYYKPDNKERDIKFSFILPFMFNGDRWPLFESTIKRLHELVKDDSSIEIIVHETSPKRHISDDFIEKYNIVYIFNEINILFHRAWNLNVVSRYIARGEYFVFMDGDLIIDKKWMDVLYKVDPNKVYVGWNTLYNFTKKGTNEYIKQGTTPKTFARIRKFTHPENGAAAGINIIPKSIFDKVGGWPECFGGSGYGGEDNSMYMKLKAFGYNYITLNATIYHLFHTHRTSGVKNKKYDKMPVNSYIVNNQRKMQPDDWVEYSFLERNYNWGWCEELEKSMIKETDAYYNASLINSFIKSKEPLITLCMVNYKRFNTLIEVLERYKKLGVALNLILYMNDSSNIPDNTLNRVHELCKDTFVKYEVILDKENHGTAKARNIMLSKAYNEYKTPYVMTTDDDILFEDPESLVVSATVLHQEKYKEFGSVGIGCKPSYFFIQIHNKKFVQIKPIKGFQEVAVLGAATMMIRREVLRECNTDPEYPRVGFVDWDFSMNITTHGWKIGVVFEEHYQAFNDARGHGNEYNSNRYKKPMIQQAYYRFVDKWKVTPLIAPKWLT